MPNSRKNGEWVENGRIFALVKLRQRGAIGSEAGSKVLPNPLKRPIERAQRTDRASSRVAVGGETLRQPMFNPFKNNFLAYGT